MRLYIIRHGETRANEKGYLQGWSNDPLNQRGRELAIITGQAMKNLHFDYCISSPLVRATETAEIILRESENNLNIVTDNRIMEINFGDYEYSDIRDTYAVKFLTEPNVELCFPNGESIRKVMERTQLFLKWLISLDNNDEKNYLISTHGCALRCMLNSLYDNPHDFWHGHVPYNCAVNIVEHMNGFTRLVADDIVYYDRDSIVDRYCI